MKAKLTALSCMLAAAGLASPLAMAQEKVKIGFVTGLSRLYADVDGKNAVTAMQMAIDDFGGKVLGGVKHPLNASDFSSFLLQAQASKAQILGLANAGGDTINTIKAANEFGVTKSMKMAGLLIFINDIHSLGLNLTQCMYLPDGW